MALIFMDSFDHYASADIATKWTSNDNNTITANGRNGTSAMRATSGGQKSTKSLPSSYTTLVVGFAYKTSSLSPTTTICSLLEGTTLHVDIQLRADGKLNVTRGDSTHDG